MSPGLPLDFVQKEPHIHQLLAHRERMIACIRRKVASEDLAEDLLQEARLGAIRAAPSLRNEERLLPWFYTALNNAITDNCRRGGVTACLFTPFNPA